MMLFFNVLCALRVCGMTSVSGECMIRQSYRAVLMASACILSQSYRAVLTASVYYAKAIGQC